MSSNMDIPAASQGGNVFTYDRSWVEIEEMIQRAEERQQGWRIFYNECKEHRDQDGMKEAARNHKALEGVIKTLRWVCGEEGIRDPLN
jgi:hypothetical protein